MNNLRVLLGMGELLHTTLETNIASTRTSSKPAPKAITKKERAVRKKKKIIAKKSKNKNKRKRK